MNTVEIRLQLLRDIGTGFSRAETVKHLTEKFGISKQGAYYHFTTKDKWLKNYADFSNAQDLQFRILTQLNHVNREASFQYLQSQDPNAKIGFLRVRLDALGRLAEYGLPANMQPSGNIHVTADWKNKTEAINQNLENLKRYEEILRSVVSDTLDVAITELNLSPEEHELIVKAVELAKRKELEQVKQYTEDQNKVITEGIH